MGSYTRELLSSMEAFLSERGVVQGGTVHEPRLQAPKRCSIDPSDFAHKTQIIKIFKTVKGRASNPKCWTLLSRGPCMTALVTCPQSWPRLHSVHTHHKPFIHHGAPCQLCSSHGEWCLVEQGISHLGGQPCFKMCPSSLKPRRVLI